MAFKLYFFPKLVVVTVLIQIPVSFSWITYPSILYNPDAFRDAHENETLLNKCGDKLFFTELIQDFATLLEPEVDNVEKWKRDEEVQYVWREQARVNLNNLSEIKSYSGFFTVNKEYNSNLFFWFFPAAFEPEKAPIILWLNGGPGTSSLFGLFVEHGPFKINNQGFLETRQYAWTMSHSVIYIDNPVGTGFSFTENVKGYSKNQIDISNNLFQALQQFFRAFPEYSQRQLYIGGESYAGKYVPALSLKIHLENKKKGQNINQIKIKLAGLILGSPFIDPFSQNEYGDYLYHLGLIDEPQKEIFIQQENEIKDLIENEEWSEATKLCERLIVGDPETSTSLFHNMTGFTEYLNVLESSTPKDFRNYVSYLNRPNVRQSIHVGDQPYTRSPEVLESLKDDISKSTKTWVERLLKENYRILIYSSQLDLVVPHVGVQKLISNLDWPGSSLFSRVPRKAWKVNGEIAGYTKFARNLAYVLVRNSGHIAPYNQPLWIYEMVNRFTREKPF